MTARKANAFGAAVGQAATARRTRRPDAPAAAPLPSGGKRKYTLLLDDEIAEAFDEQLVAIRRLVGRRVDKSQVVRELLALLQEDKALAAQVSDRLKLR